MQVRPALRGRLLLFVAALSLTALANAQSVSNDDTDRGSRPREESWQIEQRQLWFIQSRSLDRAVDAATERRNAVNRLKLDVERLAPLQRAAGETWSPLGPSSMNMGSWTMGRVSGRTNAVTPHPSDENTVYFGAAAGGVWKTTNGGTSWTPLFDQVGTLPIGAVFVEASAPNNVWAGTGDKNGGGCAGYFGQGVYLSTDSGATWQARNGSGAGAMPLSIVNAVAVQPTNANVVLAGGAGSCSATGSLSGSGLYRSADRGVSWSKTLNGNVEDIVFVPGTATVYAGVGGGGVYKSIDGGANWTASNTGLSVSGSRLRLAMAASNTSVLYALQAGSLYRSADGGASWSLRSNSACEGQCTYNLAIDVHPTQPDTILVGSIRAARSTNGGSSFTFLTTTWGSSQTVHQDTHVVRYSRIDPNRFWIGSDGGVWRTDNGGSGWVNMNSNLNVTQFYDISVHPTNPDIVFGGAQDNSSSSRSTSSVWNLTFVSGDGFMNAIDATNPSIVFQTSYPSGGFPSIYRSTTGGGANSFSKLATTGMTSSSSFPWVTPMAVASNRLFTASNVVYRATTSASPMSWTAVTGSLGSAVSVLTPVSMGVLIPTYAGTSGGRIYATPDAAVPSSTWTDVTGNYPGGVVSDIAMDPLNAQRVFVTRAGFGASRLYRSTSGGTNWSAVGTGLPNVPANAVAIDPQNTNRIFVGTDVGVYESADGGNNFVAFSTGLPLGLVVTDLEIDDSPHVLSAGTYGRGAWKVTLNSGGNVAPTANFSVATSALTANFTDTSTDSDGTLTSRSWNFGDGGTSTATNPNHTYVSAGTYTVTLTVTDNGGASNTKTASVTVTGGPANTPPVANFASTTNGLTATFTDTSTDPDGTIASRSWNFGDGGTSTATNPSRTYAAAGTYTVTLTVTDNGGATNTRTGSVTVTAPPVDTVLQNGVAKTGLSIATGGSLSFTMVVPAGATGLKFVTSGGTGDADLYAKFGSAASATNHDCKSEGSTNAETCSIATAQAGTYHVYVYGYAAVSGMSLTGSFTTGGGPQTYSNTTDYAIGDNTTVESPITVSGRTGNAPSNASVTVAIVHTYQGDLKVDLVAPDGSLYNIHNYSGGGTDNINTTVTFNLSSEPLNGTWKLRVNDNAGGDTGRIDSWSITF
jgi:PKD repeat protein